MTNTQVKRLARSGNVEAVIVSDGCRDYVIELHTASGDHILTDRKRRPRRFASLELAKRAVKRATSVRLAVRIAADEACAGETLQTSPFAHLPLTQKLT